MSEPLTLINAFEVPAVDAGGRWAGPLSVAPRPLPDCAHMNHAAIAGGPVSPPSSSARAP